MKKLFSISMCLGAGLLVSCETTQTAGMGNQERKRMAQLQREQEEAAQIDEADRNLWNAQVDRMTRDSNPAIRY